MTEPVAPRTARIILTDPAGRPRGSLPAVPVETPWWQDVAPVVAAVRDRHGVDITVLRLLSAQREVPHGGLVTYIAEAAVPSAKLIPWPGVLPDHPLRLPYAKPGGPASDLAWATGTLAAIGLHPVSAPQQIRTWNLSSLWRIPLAGQMVWFKAVPGFFAHEGAVIAMLAGAPIPDLLGHDGSRLLLSEIPGPDHFDDTDPALLMAMVDVLVGIQADWLGREHELLGLGMPDWRANPLSAAIADTVHRTADQLAADDQAVLAQFVDQLPARFAALDACGFGHTIVHGDCHPGNFRGPADRLTLLDWGDCGFGHPALDLASLLDGIPPTVAKTVEQHWHDRWRSAVPGCDPARAADIIAPIAAARQAAVYRRFLDNIEPSEHPYHRADPADWLRRTAALARVHAIPSSKPFPNTPENAVLTSSDHRDLTAMPPVTDHLRLSTAAVRWRCPPEWTTFATTADVPPVHGVIGQDDALEALRFGLQIEAPGQNIYVRGLTGTGRVSLVEQLLKDAIRPCPPANDRCYVHNFAQPDQPALLTLPRGQARTFQAAMDGFIRFVEQQLGPALNSDTVRARRATLDESVQQSLRDLGKPFEQELAANNLALVPVQMGEVVQPAILPLVDDEPVTLQKFAEVGKERGLTSEEFEAIYASIAGFARKLEDIGQKTQEVQAAHREALRDLFQSEARRVLGFQVEHLTRIYPQAEVAQFLAAVCGDLVDNRLQAFGKDMSFVRLYRVNPILAHGSDDACPVAVETSPSLLNLLGNIDREAHPGGFLRSDHLMIHAGSLLRADGGYLVIQARDILAEPGAWKILLRTLRTGLLEIVPPEFAMGASGPILKPQPIPVSVKVILVGDPGLYQALDGFDPDFAYLFKVLADFESTIARDETGVGYYAGVLARIVENEGLPHLDAGAVAAIAEHGARVSAQAGRLTIRFGRLSDIVREAAFLARGAGEDTVTAARIVEAIDRGRARSDLPARQYRKRIADGTIRIETSGQQVGQINGLAVIQAGPLTFGFPSRITATIGPGTAGAVNIEREAELSGAIHTKGFYILGGLLRYLLRTDHPLAFSASIAFEQSYGGIDGDSASGAEMCCLLSALTGVALRQDLAMTGAIDQLGHIQPIGAVTEKVEGFFAACKNAGLTGTQGAIIPRTNAGDLMLRQEVVDAIDAGQFHVYAVDTIQEALAVFTGQEVGEPDGADNYPEGTLLHTAEQRAHAFWRMARAKPNGE